MLARLFSRLRRRVETRRRLIFKFEANGKARAVDPIVVQRVLEENGGSHWRTLLGLVNTLCQPPSDAELTILTTDEAWQARSARRDEAIRSLANLSRTAFGLEPLTVDGQGVTESEAIGVLGEFIEFVGGLSRKAQPFR